MIIDPAKLLDGLLFGAALSAVDRVVLAAVARICWWAGADRGATVGQAAIAKMVDLHERTVRASIKRLILGGWVHREARNGTRGRITDLLTLTPKAIDLVPRAHGQEAAARPGLARCRPPTTAEPLHLAAGAEFFSPPVSSDVQGHKEVRHVSPGRAADIASVRDSVAQNVVAVASARSGASAARAGNGSGQRRPATLGPMGRVAGPPAPSGVDRGDRARAGAPARGNVRDVARHDAALSRPAAFYRADGAAPSSTGPGYDVVQLGFGFDAPPPRGQSTNAGASLNDSGGAAPVPRGKGQDAGADDLSLVAAQAPASPPVPAPHSPGRGAAEGMKRKRLTPEQRAARDAAEAQRKAKASQEREAKRAGEDMPLLPEIQRAWREAVAERRGGIAPEEIVISGRGISAARGYLSRLFRQVAPGRPLTDEDRAKVLTSTKSLFLKALATERAGFPVGLEIVCANPDRYQGGSGASGPATAEERRSMARQGSGHVKPGREGGNTSVPSEADLARMRAKLGIRNA